MAVEFGGEANQGFVKVDETQGAVSGHQLFGGPGEARLEEDLVHVRRGHQVVIPPEDSALFQHSVEAAQRELSERGPASKSRHLVLFVHGLQALVVGVEHPVHMLVVQDNFPKLIPHELFARLFAALEAAQNVTQKMQVLRNRVGLKRRCRSASWRGCCCAFCFFLLQFLLLFLLRLLLRLLLFLLVPLLMLLLLLENSAKQVYHCHCHCHHLCCRFCSETTPLSSAF
mmetsp:Transcript_67829/g.136504  ORF Transcript_67829/g.136504 Transcript_67829/m.136504 type:complete len:228 (-) Transcript_67829:68-751(-)